MTAMIRRGLVVLVAIVLASASGPAAWACQSCFGAEDSPLIDGARSGALALVAVVLGVQAAFVGFFLYLRRRARLAVSLELDSEWSEFQKVTR